MLRLLALAVLSMVIGSTNINSIYEQILESNIEKVGQLSLSNCIDVEGRARGCHECYHCNHPSIQTHRDQGYQVLNLELSDSTCNKTQVCCVAQSDLLTYRSAIGCGKYHPQGQPRSRRESVRSVLQGEYPWRAWVYKKSDISAPLCAATFISEISRALIVPASCVDHMPAATVGVSFVREPQRVATVDRIVIHEEFNPATHHNDIALVIIRSLESVPTWAALACLPPAPAPLATPCVVVAENEKFINSIIPLKRACVRNKGMPHDTLMCAVAPRGDYAPQKGAGLYCLEQYVRAPAYIVYGMALLQEDESVTTYTNVTHHMPWLKKNVPNL